MKSLFGFLHGILQIIFCALPEFTLGPPPRDRPNTNFGKPCQFLQKWLSHFSWHGFWMRVKGPHNYRVTTSRISDHKSE